VKAAVITVSTSKAAGEGEDESGPALAELARSLGLEVVGADLVTDDAEAISARLRHWSDDEGCALILTSGGTGFSPTDVTPEATRAVIERDAPGIGEAVRITARAHTPNWMLTRAIGGIRGRTLIVNFPGNPDSIRETGEVLAQALPHALALLAGERPH
jgi:molybdenum cofactor synthesis domain-containing protein